jgi:hypothetical protein
MTRVTRMVMKHRQWFFKGFILKTFKQYLHETPDASSKVAYHWTNFISSTNILKHDYFRATAGQTIKGLSTTTDENYKWSSWHICFVLSLSEFAKDYTITPVEESIHDDHGKKVDESEMVIVSDSAITQAHKYITEIRYASPRNELDKKELDIFLKQANEYSERYKHIAIISMNL